MFSDYYIFIALYATGSLIAIGMVLADVFDGIKESKDDYFNMYGHLDIGAVFRVLFSTIFFLILAVLFSWISVGFIYRQANE